MSSNKVYGIDLGTTQSCIAHVDEFGKPVIIPNSDNLATTPSVVLLESLDSIVVGQQAKNAAPLEHDRVVAFVKRSMGDPQFTFPCDGKDYTAEEISSFVLRRLVKDASDQLGEEVTDVVITCPAYFGHNQREATKNAGRLAGLNVIGILNEPTAAAICYGLIDPNEAGQTVLVYDLGGGTFDVTLIAVQQGDVREAYTDGNHELGGKDWDDRLAGYLAQRFCDAQAGADDPMEDPQAVAELLLSAESAKIALSTREKPVKVLFQRASLEVTREIFEDRTRDLLEQTIDITRRVLDAGAERGVTKVDRILLVGGSSRMPAVERRLKEAFGLEVVSFDPDLAVAKGAALYGNHERIRNLVRGELARSSGGVAEEIDLQEVAPEVLEQASAKVSSDLGLRLPSKDVARIAKSQISTVSSRGFGVVVLGPDRNEKVAFLIHHNTALPAEITETGFGTSVADQSNVFLQVMEQLGSSESPQLEHNRSMVEGPLPLPSGLPEASPIHVTFRLEKDGTLKVKALEPSSGAEIELEAKTEGVMSQERVEESRRQLMQVQVSG